MKVGDVVIPKSRDRVFHCGSSIYSHAIVASLSPFVLVTSDSNMLWSKTWEPSEVTPLCQASLEIQKMVADRLADHRGCREVVVGTIPGGAD